VEVAAVNYVAYPEMAIWLLAPLGLLVAGLWLSRWKNKSIALLGTVPNDAFKSPVGTVPTGALYRLLPEGLDRKRRWILSLQVLGMLALALSLMGPLLGARLVEFRQKGLDVFIAVDCSTSMLAEDFKPNRMSHARLVLGQLIDRLHGSRIGVIAFAGQAYVQCPLTIDQGAARDTLDSLDTGAVPIAGTRIGDAIRLAAKGMQAGEGSNRVLVLLTDGEDHKSEPKEAALEAAKAGMKVYAIGIGSAEGEPIPLFDAQGNRAGVKRDRQGDVILSRLDETTLVEIARETGGDYFRASPSGDEVEPLTRALEQLQTGDQKTQLFNRYENRFQWPLALGILLLFISLMIPEHPFRSSSPAGSGGGSINLMGPRLQSSGATPVKTFIILFTISSVGLASESQLKHGNREFKRGNYEQAQKLYEDALIDRPHSPVLHFNVGAAAYQKGDFERAEKEFTESAQAAVPGLKEASHYNRGNTLFRQSKWDEAIEAYKEALRINPKDENAKYNLGVALRAKQNPPKQQRQQQGPSKQQEPKEGQGPKEQQGEGDKKDKTQKPTMSKEDAERLLAAAAAGERKKSDQKTNKEQKAGQDEDW